MAKQIKASDCNCCECGEPAVCFWPCFDPDIPSRPYCRACKDEIDERLIIAICEMQEKKETS